MVVEEEKVVMVVAVEEMIKVMDEVMKVGLDKKVVVAVVMEEEVGVEVVMVMVQIKEEVGVMEQEMVEGITKEDVIGYGDMMVIQEDKLG